MGIFDVARLFFTLGEETRKYNYLDYQELYFQVNFHKLLTMSFHYFTQLNLILINDILTSVILQDYSFCPMFVQENYPHSTPAKAKGNNVQVRAFQIIIVILILVTR